MPCPLIQFTVSRPVNRRNLRAVRDRRQDRLWIYHRLILSTEQRIRVRKKPIYTKDKCLLHIGIPQVLYAMEAHSREIFMKALLGPSKRMSLSISTTTSAPSIGVGV